jgi:1-acyl-sn-glycerol-3-phosphate acyltransferase
MAKKELFKIPLVNKLVAALGAFPVDRGGADVSAIKKAIGMLQSGRCIGIFPQGHREKGKTPLEANLKNGAAMLAARTGATILPCCIKAKKNRFAFFRRIDVYVGKPIPFEELCYDHEKSGEYTRMTSYMFSKVCELYENFEEQETKRGE